MQNNNNNNNHLIPREEPGRTVGADAGSGSVCQGQTVVQDVAGQPVSLDDILYCMTYFFFDAEHFYKS